MNIEKIIRKTNRIIAIFIATLMCMTIFTAIPAVAEVGINIFNYDDYVIEYAIVNEWDNSQNIEIKITNTGGEPIYNWALKYDAGGEITGLWNGTIFENDGTNYIIKNAGYNYEIMPGENVSFGYTLNGDNLTVPDSIENCAKRTEITEGCYIQLVTEDNWEGGFTGYIEILNGSEESFEAWMLSFDMNFTVTDLWNAAIIESSEHTYKVSSQIMSNPIQPGDSVRIGISGSYDTDIFPEITNNIFSVVKIDKDFSAEDNYKDNSDNNIHDDSDELVGKIYFKDISSTDDFIYDSEGNCYFKNQVLLTAYDNVSFEEVKELADSLNAEIVGYIELTNDYQIEFKNNMSIDELLNAVEMLSANPIFELVTPNIISEVSCDNSSNNEEEPFPNDEKIQSTNLDKTKKINNNNANLYAINAYDAWKSYFDLSSSDRHTVKIGIIDTGFYAEHEDLHFTKFWNAANDLADNHGTGVSGIIGAEFNNGKGIAGICPETELYAYDFNARHDTNIASKISIMHTKYVLALLIGNNIKVINISMSIKGDNDLEIGTKVVEHMLNKLLDKGYDFVIVNSAGNFNDSKSEEIKKAKENSYFNNIKKGTPAYDHIIVVGAVVNRTETWDEIEKDPVTNKPIREPQSVFDEYEYKNNSKYDDRVDIVAMGNDIPTTSNGSDSYSTIKDTSAAAPQVAGVAGLVYSVNPSLKGNDVKRIVLGSANKSADLDNPDSENKRKITFNGYNYALLDAKAALDMALGINTGESTDNKEEAIVFGTITNKDGEPVSYANIYARSKTTSEIKEFQADSDGSYLITLPPDTYDMLYINTVVVDKLLLGWFIDLEINDLFLFHQFKNKEIEFGEAYPLDVKLDNDFTKLKYVYFYDSYGNNLSIVGIEMINYSDNNVKYTTTVNSSSFAYTGIIDNGEYTISVSKPGYVSKTLKATAKDGVLYDENGEILEKIVLIQQSTITGKVTEHNTTTQEIKPIADFPVSILQDGEFIAGGTTKSNGIYEIVIDNHGDIIVDFNGYRQRYLYVTGGEYEADMEFLTENKKDDDDDDDDDDNDDNDGDDNNNNKDGDNDNDDDNSNGQGNWNTENGEDINITLNGTDDTSYNGDFPGDLSDGIWISTSKGYYVKIYSSSGSGKVSGTLVPPAWGVATYAYSNWVNNLTMEIYNSSGELRYKEDLDWFYCKTDINYGSSLELYTLKGITSISITSTGLSYTMSTHGFFKSRSGISGGTYFYREEWDEENTKSVSFYSYGSMVSASNKNPF